MALGHICHQRLLFYSWHCSVKESSGSQRAGLCPCPALQQGWCRMLPPERLDTDKAQGTCCREQSCFPRRGDRLGDLLDISSLHSCLISTSLFLPLFSGTNNCSFFLCREAVTLAEGSACRPHASLFLQHELCAQPRARGALWGRVQTQITSK